MVRKEIGVKVDRRMVVAVPDWDIFNNPKERPRSSKKPVVFEEPDTSTYWGFNFG
jgi:hypothetical protein